MRGLLMRADKKSFSRKDAKGAKRCRVSKSFLCAFAPLREKHFLPSEAERDRSVPSGMRDSPLPINYGASVGLMRHK